MSIKLIKRALKFLEIKLLFGRQSWVSSGALASEKKTFVSWYAVVCNVQPNLPPNMWNSQAMRLHCEHSHVGEMLFFSFYFALHSSLNVRLWKIQLCYKWKVLHSSRKTRVCEVKNYRSNFIAPTELFCGCKCHCVIFLVWVWFWWNFQRECKPPRCHMIIVPKWNWNKCKISTVNEYIVCT